MEWSKLWNINSKSPWRCKKEENISVKYKVCQKRKRVPLMNTAVLEQTSLLTWPGSVWLFPFPSQAQGGHQGDLFSGHGSHQEGCDDVVEDNPGRILPGVHGGMVEKDGTVTRVGIILEGKTCSL